MVVSFDKSERLQVEHCYFCKVAEHSNSITLLPFITVFNGQAFTVLVCESENVKVYHSFQAFTVLVCLPLAARVLFGSQERIVS